MPLLGAVPEGAGHLDPTAFRSAAPHWLAPRLEGVWDAEAFHAREAPSRAR
ncbi:dethiobiotin synthetase [Streptomyces sp. di50b]|nr:dethiobiotin synthetase [Streptomyces sp. di50b]